MIQYAHKWFLHYLTEPKPPRSASQDERAGGAMWNIEERAIPPIQHISNISGLNLSLTSTAGDFLGGVGGNVNENECVLHVICSPLVSVVGSVKLWRSIKATIRTNFTFSTLLSPSQRFIQITHDQLWRLFDIVPNLDFCKMNNDGGN